MEAEIVGISFSVKEHKGYYVPFRYPGKEKNNFGEDDEKVVLDKLTKLFEDQSILKTGQNIKYGSLVLKKLGINIEGISFDTMVAAHLINPSAKSISLDTLSIEYLNFEMIPILDLIGKGKNQINMGEVPLEKVSLYASECTDLTFQLTKILKKKLKEKELFTYFNTIELPLIKVLIQMEFMGTFVDINLLKTMSEDIGEKLDVIISSIYALAGKEFNINSTQQLATILFDELDLPKIKNRSTAETVLKQLGVYHELPKQILDYRKYFKLKNTYLDSLQKLISKDTGRIHSTFNQTIAATGRLSSTNPNFQNIPIRREEGKEIRKAFRAEKKIGKYFLLIILK